MTAINHALTGTLIGLVVGEPLLAVPVALASHFVCDALPHYDSEPKGERVQTHGFRAYLITDAGLCISLVLVLALSQPQHWLLAAVCAFLATAPDFFWINRYRAIHHQKPWQPNIFLRFANDIQWFARPIGAAVELAWFAATVILLVPFLR